MTRSGSRQFFQSLQFVVAVDDLQSDRAAERRVLPGSSQKFNLVGLKFLTTASTVASLTPPQFLIDGVVINAQSSRKPIDQSQHCFAV